MSTMAVVSSFSSVFRNPNSVSLYNSKQSLNLGSFVAGNGKDKTFRYNSSFSASVVGVKVKFEFPGKSGGSSVLERPGFDQSQFETLTQAEEGGDIGRFKDKKFTGFGDSYRVLLVDDIHHTEKLVAKVLPQAVPTITPDNARKLFLESRTNGVAVVIVTVKEHAEFYSQMMVRGGLRSAIEPDSDLI